MKLPRLLLAVFFALTPYLVAQNPVPFLTQALVPTSVAPGSPGFSLTVSGTGFTNTSVVNWNGVGLPTTFVSSSKLTANVPATKLTAAKTASITVFSPTPGGGTSNPLPFAVRTSTNSLTFSASNISVGLNPVAFVVADFNNDGKPDIAVINQNQPDATCYPSNNGAVGTVSILLGAGDGTFSQKARLCIHNDLSVNGAGPIAVGDFNGDGILDLVVSYKYRITPEAGSILYLGNGDGTFTLHANVVKDVTSQGIPAVADFNSDGHLDLAFPFVSDPAPIMNVVVSRGATDATFDNFWNAYQCNTYECVAGDSAAAGDFNGDGILDLALVSHLPSFGLTILRGVGDASFSKPTQQPSVTLVNPQFVASGDFDGDGRLDLAIADAGANSVVILHGNADGTFTQVNGQPSCGASNYLAMADLNGDGKLDLVTSNGGSTIQISLGNGDGTFQSCITKTVGNGVQAIAIADINGDGRLDIATANFTDSTISILLQTSAAPTNPVITVPDPAPTAEAASASGASVTYEVTVTDASDPNPKLTCSPASATTFPLGSTKVSCSATNASGGSATASFNVTVSDTTAPTLTVPSSVVADAVSPSGATITYIVTATDLVDPNPTISCTPASGSLFAIGTATVSCTAKDFSLNSSSGTFTVLVKAAAQQVTDLIAMVDSFNLAHGINNSLDAKLQNAEASLTAANSGNKSSVCNLMSAFISETNAQSGKALTAAEAAQLVNAATRIRNVLACP